jgi:1-acyl-sn-glycerol-3-phosphate acyltransferase
MAFEEMPTRVQPPLRPIAPAFRPWVLAVVQALLPLLRRLRLFPWLPAGIARVEVENIDELARCWHRFASGQARLILAFRHAEVDDPLLGLTLLARDLPRAARRLGLPLPRPLHAHFLFDRGMPLWGGRALGWLLASLGGVSVHRGRHPDWLALRQARRLVLEGRFPFAVAPEGATNGHGECIGPLEPGVAQLGLWCAEDLCQGAGASSVQVQLLPVTLQYRYLRADWPRLARLMTRLEHTIGLPPPPVGSPGAHPYPRLVRLGEALLERLEDFYGRLERAPAPNAALPERIERLRDRVLTVAERQLGLRAEGTPVDRCRRLEEQAWRWIYRDDLPPRSLLSPLDRDLAERAAQEAGQALIHMRLAETFVAVSGTYVAERPSYERFMETTLLLHDALARLRGDRLPRRPRLGARCARLSIGTPIEVGERWSGRSRAERKQVVAAITAELRRSYEQALR